MKPNRIGRLAALLSVAIGAMWVSGMHLGATAEAAGPCTTTCYVNAATGNDANTGASAGQALKTIQAGIDSVSPGGTVRVYPGAYSETASNRTLTSIGGIYQFGLFVGDAKSGITVQGVTSGGSPITTAANAQAIVTTNATNNFGPSGVFIEGDGVTIRGIEIGTNSAGQNKTIEVIGDDFTLANSRVNDPDGSVYINDFRFDTGSNTSHVKSYHLLGNVFAPGCSVDIASGAGFSGPVGARVISGNTFDVGGNSWNAISFNGSGTGVPWFVQSVGGAVIKNNSFVNGQQYIRARGDYDNSQFNWASYFNNNTFDRAVVVGPNPPADLREYSYTDGYTFNHVRRIGAVIQGEIDHAQAGDTVLVAKGTYTENLTIPTPLTLQGAGQNKVTIMPALSAPNPPSCGGSLCAGSSNVILVQANDVTITGLTVDGDNPALSSGISVGGADLDARNGIITNHTAGTFNNLTVHHVTVKNIYLRGMYASSGGTFNFHHNTVTNVQADPASIAMFAYGGGPGLMTDNTVSWSNDAISANHSKGIQFLRNTVTHSASGVHTDNAGDGGGVADLIEDNTVTQCMKDGYGVWVFVPYIAPTVRHNTVKGCAVGLGLFGSATTVPTLFEANEADGQGATLTEPGDTDGIVIWTYTFGFGDLSANATVNGNVLRNFDYGVQVLEGGGKDATATFDRNLIRNNGTGLDSGAGTVVSLTGSCVRDNDNGGVLNELGAVTTASKNSIVANAYFGASNADAATMDFESNFWGSSAGPVTVGSNKVVGPLDTTPFVKNDQGRCNSERWNSDGAHGNGGDDHHGGDDHEGNDDNAHANSNNDNGHHGDSKPHGHENGDDR